MEALTSALEKIKIDSKYVSAVLSFALAFCCLLFIIHVFSIFQSLFYCWFPLMCISFFRIKSLKGPLENISKALLGVFSSGLYTIQTLIEVCIECLGRVIEKEA